MSKNYLELKHYFPELFEKIESNSNVTATSFNAIPNEIIENFDANLQLTPELEDEEQTI